MDPYLKLAECDKVFFEGEQFLWLRNDGDYFPGLWDLRHNATMLKRWQQVFRSNFEYIMQLIGETGGNDILQRAVEAQRIMLIFLDALETRRLVDQYPTVHHITIFREHLLTQYGIMDPYAGVKNPANARAVSLYPRITTILNSIPDFGDRIKESCIRLFAGNIYDFGSVDITRRHQDKPLRYSDLVRRVRKKRWFHDDLEVWLDSITNCRDKGLTILFFVDNAGYDFVCGCIPLARTLAVEGHSVILTANETPSLNDITFEEALVIFNRLQTLDPVLRALKDQGRIRIVSSGNRVPGMDFRKVGRFINMDGKNAQQMILEGQGRAIETNWNARFGIDCIRLSTVKEPSVADAIGAKPLDMILKYDRGTPRNLKSKPSASSA